VKRGPVVGQVKPEPDQRLAISRDATGRDATGDLSLSPSASTAGTASTSTSR
jgi:hypothetical protein